MNSSNKDEPLQDALGYIHYLHQSVHDLKEELESMATGPGGAAGGTNRREREEFDEVSSSRRSPMGALGEGEGEDTEREEDPSGLLKLKVSKIDNCIYSLHIVCSGGLDKVARTIESLDVEVMNANMTVRENKSNCYYLLKAVQWDPLSISEIRKRFTELYSSLRQ